MTRTILFTISASLALAACGDNPDLDGEELTHEQQAILSVKEMIGTELDALAAAAAALQQAAPTPDADGWNPTDDAAAVSSMRAEWKKARNAYERIEGAIAVLFPDLDESTDERYDGFIAEEGDDYLFDGEGVRGIHGIERILWADSIPEHVVAFESALPGYEAAAFPANGDEATDFREKLVQRLVDETAQMRDDFAGLALDNASAFRGVIGSLEEQLEKVRLASTGEDESRYAQYTMADMRANLDGGRKVYEAFQPWLLTLENGASIDAGIEAGFDRIEAGYDAVEGDAIPTPPEGFDADEPTEEHLATPYGQLFTLLRTETDLTASTSLVHQMSEAGDALGIPQL